VRVAVFNGVNLDVLHRRDPDLYGGLTLNQLETRIYEWAREFDLIADCRHTNSEGLYVAWCHDALDWAGGVVVNPGAWSHYSYAIRDALELFDVPVIEVHLSDIEKREEWRRHSVIADVVATRILGKGPDGYREALENLAKGVHDRSD
jgi:3-dehydroquinate dehydratase II